MSLKSEPAGLEKETISSAKTLAAEAELPSEIKAAAETTFPDQAPAEEKKVSVASPWQLMWWKFRRHRLAVISALFLLLVYLVAILAEFFAPFTPTARTRNILMPPEGIHFIDPQGTFHLRPFVYGLEQTRDMETLAYVYEPNLEEIYPLQFFVEGEPYKLWGLVETDLHLFGVPDRGIFLAGTDHLGRDLLSRLIYGARISLTVGLVGVFLSLTLGLVLGGISGLYGGKIDTLIQRVIETIISIPSIPFWMALAAVIPLHWSPVKQYFAILVILSLLSWTSVARIARGKFLATREQDFVTAARLYNASQGRLIVRYLIPTFMSFIIVRVTLDIPRIIIAETALSFLGIGLREPTVSWGTLLQAAQKFQVVALHPWLWIGPALGVVTVVLAFNFVGDGLRDAADPFSR